MSAEYTYFDNLGTEINEIPGRSILSKGLLNSPYVKVTLFGFDTGQELTEHTAAYPAVLHFLEGDADLTLGGDAHQAHAGTWVYMHAHLPHSLVARTPVKMLLLLFAGDNPG